LIDCKGALINKNDAIRGDRIVVQFIGEYQSFNLIRRTGAHRGKSTTFKGEVCCTITHPIRSRIHKI